MKQRWIFHCAIFFPLACLCWSTDSQRSPTQTVRQMVSSCALLSSQCLSGEKSPHLKQIHCQQAHANYERILLNHKTHFIHDQQVYDQCIPKHRSKSISKEKLRFLGCTLFNYVCANSLRIKVRKSCCPIYYVLTCCILDIHQPLFLYRHQILNDIVCLPFLRTIKIVKLIPLFDCTTDLPVYWNMQTI